MFSNFSTEKTGILLENLPKCQNSSKGGTFAYNFTNHAMFSNFSTEKTGILLENLSECQNSSKGDCLHIIFTNLAMFSNFSSEKTGILLENLPEYQNSSKGGAFAYNFYEPCNVLQFFNNISYKKVPNRKNVQNV